MKLEEIRSQLLTQLQINLNAEFNLQMQQNSD